MERRYYDEYARVQGAHWWFAGRRRIIRSLLEGTLGSDACRGLRILDVGCGTGTNLEELARFGRVEGVESEQAAVEYCQERGWRVARSTGERLPFDDACFDVVTLLDVIEHVPDDAAILGEARRVLRPGGTLLVTVPAYTWLWGDQDEISHHYRRYTATRLGHSLEGAGLEPVRLTYFNSFLFPPIAAIRLLRRLRPRRGEARSDFELNDPGRLNDALARVFGSEAALVRRADLPFGVSVAAVARPTPL